MGMRLVCRYEASVWVCVPSVMLRDSSMMIVVHMMTDTLCPQPLISSLLGPASDQVPLPLMLGYRLLLLLYYQEAVPRKLPPVITKKPRSTSNVSHVTVT